MPAETPAPYHGLDSLLDTFFEAVRAEAVWPDAVNDAHVVRAVEDAIGCG